MINIACHEPNLANTTRHIPANVVMGIVAGDQVRQLKENPL